MMTITKAEQLRQSVQSIWASYHTHPFVQGLGDGTLCPKKFAFFMVQDYLYLYDYAKVFALGLSKAPTRELAHFFAEHIHGILGGEMGIHRAYMARLGIDDARLQHTCPTLDNVSYTNYMLSVAHSGDVLDVLATVLACAWSYAEIGEQIVKQHPNAIHHPLYGEWVRGYTSEDYVNINNTLLDLFNHLCQNISETKWAKLCTIFKNCSLYELAFWDMAWKGEPCTP